MAGGKLDEKGMTVSSSLGEEAKRTWRSGYVIEVVGVIQEVGMIVSRFSGEVNWTWRSGDAGLNVSSSGVEGN